MRKRRETGICQDSLGTTTGQLNLSDHASSLLCCIGRALGRSVALPAPVISSAAVHGPTTRFTHQSTLVCKKAARKGLYNSMLAETDRLRIKLTGKLSTVCAGRDVHPGVCGEAQNWRDQCDLRLPRVPLQANAAAEDGAMWLLDRAHLADEGRPQRPRLYS